MLETLFNLLSDLLKTLSFVKHVSMYLQQDLFQKDNRLFKPTAVFVTYENLNYTDIGHYHQVCDYEVVLKILVEEYTLNYFKALEQKDCIVLSLQHYLNLVRVNEIIDTNPDGLFLWAVRFKGTFLDDLTPNNLPNIGGTSGINWNVQETVLLNGTAGFANNLPF